MEFGMAGVAAITVICYLAGLAVKASPWDNDRYIPLICGASGGILGLAALYLKMPELPVSDPLSACAVGIVSGLAATGVNQMVKQMNQ